MKFRTIPLLFAGLMLIPAPACAQGYKPVRPVEIVVHSGTGTGNDMLARVIRAIFEKEQLLPVRSVVLNKTGGNGAAAMAYLAERKGETHIIALYTAAWFTAPMMSREAHVQFNDLTPIANLIRDTAIVVVKADAPYKTIGDFIEAARKTPGKLLQAGVSVEARPNLIRLLIQRQSGATWTHIPYTNGGERIATVLGGHAQILMGDPTEISEHVKSGALRAIVQIAKKRLSSFAAVPTLHESGVDIPPIVSPRGAIAPPGLPKEVVEYWENLFARLIKSDAWRRYVADNQVEESYLKGAEFAKFADELVAQRRHLFAEFGIKTGR